MRFICLFGFVVFFFFCLSEWRLHEPEAKFEHNFHSHWEVCISCQNSKDGEKNGRLNTH